LQEDKRIDKLLVGYSQWNHSKSFDVSFTSKLDYITTSKLSREKMNS